MPTWVRLLLFAAAAVAGCAPGPPPKEASTPAAPEVNEAVLIKRGKERQVAQNDLRQLAQLYIFYTTEKGKPPTGPDDLDAYSVDGRSMVQKIREGTYIARWGVNPAGSVVLLYEKGPDHNGNQVVAHGDGSVKLMSNAELQAALKNQGG